MTAVRTVGLIAGSLLLVSLSSCGARVVEPAPDWRAQQLTLLVEQRDWLTARVAQLEAQLADPAGHVAPSRDEQAMVVRRWVERGSVAGNALNFRACVSVFDREQVAGGQAIALMWDSCGDVHLDSRGPRLLAVVEALLRDELFACWVIADPQGALPECFPQFAHDERGVVSAHIVE